MFGKRFEKELEMIDKALASEQGEKDMRKILAPFVESVVDKYISDKKITDIKRDKLIKAGWTHFHVTLKRYKGRTEMMLEGKNNVYYFNTYFNWYIRQGILEYLNSLKK